MATNKNGPGTEKRDVNKKGDSNVGEQLPPYREGTRPQTGDEQPQQEGTDRGIQREGRENGQYPINSPFFEQEKAGEEGDEDLEEVDEDQDEEADDADPTGPINTHRK